MADFAVSGDGSIVLLRPITDTAREWVEDHIGEDNGFQPYWPTVVIEVNYAGPIIEGIREDGLEVE